MAFKYSAFTVMMPDLTLEEAAVALKELGFQGVEWRVHSVPEEFPAETDYWRGNRATVDVDTIGKKAKEVSRLSKNNGLEIVCLGTYLSYKMLDDIERCMEAACVMGCGSLRVSPPRYSGSENYNDLFEEAIEGYARVEELAREYKVRANIELHHGNICCSAGLSYKLVSNFDPDCVGVIYDPGNMVHEGYEKWQMGLELLGPYLSHVHVKNAAWLANGSAEDGTRLWKQEMVPLKEGFVNWEDVVTALNNVGYRGWMSFEDFSTGDTRTKLADDKAYITSLEERLGI